MLGRKSREKIGHAGLRGEVECAGKRSGNALARTQCLVCSCTSGGLHDWGVNLWGGCEETGLPGHRPKPREASGPSQ